MQKHNAKLTSLTSSSDITLKPGSLMLDLGNGDEIHIDGFDQSDVLNSSSIGSFEFDDGTRWRTCAAVIRSGKAASSETANAGRIAA